MFLEPVRKQRPPREDPSIGLRIGIVAVVVLLLFSVLAFRLWFLQVLSGDQYVTLANDNRVRTVRVGPRDVQPVVPS